MKRARPRQRSAILCHASTVRGAARSRTGACAIVSRIVLTACLPAGTGVPLPIALSLLSSCRRGGRGRGPAKRGGGGGSRHKREAATSPSPPHCSPMGPLPSPEGGGEPLYKQDSPQNHLFPVPLRPNRGLPDLH